MLNAMMAFDHIPASYSTPANQAAAISNYSDYPIAIDNTDSWANPVATQNMGIVVDSEGTWIGQQVLCASGGGGMGWKIPLSSVVNVATRATYMGYRFKCSVASTAIPGTHVMSISNGAANAGNYFIPMAIAGAATAVSTGVTFAAGVSVYVEHLIDRVNNIIKTWVNNVFVSQVPISPGPVASTNWFIIGQTGGSPNTTAGSIQMLWKDFYFLDDTQDNNLPNSRLGALTFTRSALAAAAGSGWTSSDGTTLLADLQTALSTTPATWTAPTANSPAAPVPPLVLGYTNNVTPGNAVRAVINTISAQPSGGGSATGLAASLIDTSSNSESYPTYPIPDASMHLGMSLGAKLFAPDGGIWTPAKIDSTSLSVQPGLV